MDHIVLPVKSLLTGKTLYYLITTSTMAAILGIEEADIMRELDSGGDGKSAWGCMAARDARGEIRWIADEVLELAELREREG